MPNRKSMLTFAAAAFCAAPALAQDGRLKAHPVDPASGAASPPSVFFTPIDGPGFDLNWFTVDGGGATYLTGGGFELGATAGQPDAGEMSGGSFTLGGGFWYGAIAGNTCYANCDGSSGSPLLTANDFTCFVNAYAIGAAYANCDGSTGIPALTANDFTCFINAYALGCS